MVKNPKTSNPPEESLLGEERAASPKHLNFPVAIQLGKINSRNKADTKNADSVGHSPIFNFSQRFECFTAGNIDNHLSQWKSITSDLLQLTIA